MVLFVLEMLNLILLMFLYYEQIKSDLSDQSDLSDIKILDFLARMDYAYAVADLVVSRAGASSISELSLLGKSSILVPSPNVAEDHQTHNARALSDKGAAILVKDVDAVDTLVDIALETIASKETQSQTLLVVLCG